MHKCMDGSIESDARWSIVDLVLRTRGYVSHHLDSYNKIVRATIPEMIRNHPPITIGPVAPGAPVYTVTFGETIFTLPCFHESDGEKRDRMMPMECMHRSMTYASDVYVDVVVSSTEDSEPTYSPRVHIGCIPVMLRSCLDWCTGMTKDELFAAEEDPNDPGGYFIIRGSRKVVNPQERAAGNRIYVFANRHSPPKFDLYSEVRSSGMSRASVLQVGWFAKTRLISVLFPSLSETAALPLAVFFRLLIDSQLDEEAILRFINTTAKGRELLLPSLEYAYECRTSAQARTYVTKKYKSAISSAKGDESSSEEEEEPTTIGADVLYIVDRELFPHLGVCKPDDAPATVAILRRKKAYYLGSMVSKLLSMIMGERETEDRDHFANKRVTTTGALLSSQFYMAFRKLWREVKNMCERSLSRGTKKASIVSTLKPAALSHAMASCISSNNWGRGTNTAGISQTLEQFNYAATLANLRKFHVPMGDSGKAMAPRELHGTQALLSCPYDTPEGKKIGIVKGAALTAYISVGSDTEPILMILRDFPDFKPTVDLMTDALPSFGPIKVLLNGDWVGTLSDHKHALQTFTAHRRRGDLSYEVELGYEPTTRELRINTDAGRMMHPMLVIEDGRLRLTAEIVGAVERSRLTWGDLLTQGIVEYLGKEEADREDILFCHYPKDVTPSTTHLDLHPAMMFGVSASQIPFIQHNQAPRCSFQCAMGKAAVGTPFMNYRQMMSGTFHVLHYPQRPLVMTRPMITMKIDEMPAGCNIILAMGSFKGSNQEDSQIFNKASIERGLFRSSRYFTFRLEVTGKLGVPGIGDLAKVVKVRGNPDKLDADGIIAQGMMVESGDILIGHADRKEDGLDYADSSVLYEEDLPGEVTRVQLGVGANGYTYVSVQVAQMRIPTFGDKNCLTPDHDVLTKERGWMPIADVTMNDRVMALVNGRQHWSKPLAIMKYDCDYEETLDIGYLHTTMNHRMWVRMSADTKYSLQRADSLVGESAYYDTGLELEDAEEVLIKHTRAQVVRYTGKVHCLEVPSHVFMVRRNGTPIWTGNSSRHGQKGTIGAIVAPEDLPFCPATGMIPDMLMSPLGIPSRMTMAQLIELMFGKALTASSKLHHISARHVLECTASHDYRKVGGVGDGTAFRDIDVPTIQAELKANGIDCNAEEEMYDGITGEPLKMMVFIGPIFYQRLRHQPIDKIHARARGPRVTLTHQPRDGRAAGGGFKVGSMERDCIIGQGASKVGADRLHYESDPFKMWLCTICGLPAVCDRSGLRNECTSCGKSKLKEVGIPYGMKLLMDELRACGIACRVLCDDHGEAVRVVPL